MRLMPCLFALAITFTAGSRASADDQSSDGTVDVPITQSRIRDGNIRYGVWVKVGERWVEAMLDTGSTGLRILPSLFRGDPEGVPTQTAFGSGAYLRGVAVRMLVSIGSKSGTAVVEVVQEAGCIKEKPDCDVGRLYSDGWRIGSDGFSSEGYSAILGIGLPFRGTDVGNPLSALGVKRWIVDLPRPFEIPDGHLILDPSKDMAAGFAMLSRHGFADGDGCLRSSSLSEQKCGSVLFDTGAPAVQVSFEGVEAATGWQNGTAGTFSFKSGDKSLDLDFRAGETGGLRSVAVTPPAPKDPPGPFILAGIEPYFTYDILYDEAAHTVGLKKRSVPFRALDFDEGGAESQP